MKTDIAESKAMLLALLNEDAEASGHVLGVDDINAVDRRFLLATCSAMVIVHTVCRISGYDVAEAKRGLDALFPTMIEQITEICEKRL